MQKSNQNPKPWYKVGGPDFNQRVKHLQKYRSPATRADEFSMILRFIIMPLLALWCIVIAYSSYYAYLSHNFSHVVSLIGAAILAGVIELGKMKLGGYVFQKPFLEGKKGFEDGREFAMWAGITLFAGITFYMSVVNSTQGAKNLALLNGTKTHYSEFQPNTDAIDAQITAANSRIEAAKNTKWKGTTTWEAQKAITRESRAIENLTRQRETAVTNQRSDFEKQRAFNEQNTEKGANIIMAAGGFVEALQGVSLFLVAACMAVLAFHYKEEQEEQAQEPEDEDETTIGGVKFRKYPSYQANGAQNYGPSTPQNFFFNRTDTGQVQSAPPPPSKTVAQSAHSVPQPPTVLGADDILRNCRETVQKNLGQFNRPDANPATVSRRINEALDQAYKAAQIPGFEPTRKATIEYYNFLTSKAFPTLNAKGWPYERDEFFLRRLIDILNSQAEPA